MDRVEVLEVADLPRDAGGHCDEGLTVSRDREAPAQEDARQMEKSEGSLDRGIVAVERRPRFEEAREPVSHLLLRSTEPQLLHQRAVPREQVQELELGGPEEEQDERR